MRKTKKKQKRSLGEDICTALSSSLLTEDNVYTPLQSSRKPPRQPAFRAYRSARLFLAEPRCPGRHPSPPDTPHLRTAPNRLRLRRPRSRAAPNPSHNEETPAAAPTAGERPGAGRGDTAGGSRRQPPARPGRGHRGAPRARPGLTQASQAGTPRLTLALPASSFRLRSSSSMWRVSRGPAGDSRARARPPPQLSHPRGHRSFGHGRPCAFAPPASASPPVAERQRAALANKRAGAGPPSSGREEALP